MGTRTQLRINVTLVEDLSAEIIAALKFMTINAEDETEDEAMAGLVKTPSHRFFQCEGWTCVLLGQSTGHPETETPESRPSFVNNGVGWILKSCAAFSNYDEEIQCFCEFLSPYVKTEAGNEIGAIRYEGSREDDVLLVFNGVSIIAMQRSGATAYDGPGVITSTGFNSGGRVHF